jgi:alkylation response protein AidB-like acyl-CoA dehydrogenase
LFSATQEQIEMGALVARLLTDLDPLDPNKALASDMLNLPLWEGLSEMGVPGMVIPERWGGLELSLGHLAVVLENAGYGVSSAPLLSNAIAAFALMSADDDQVNDAWLPKLADGSATGTVAWDLSADPSSLSGVEVSRDHRLTGQVPFVLDGCTSNLLLVLGQGADGLHLYAVDAKSPGVSATFMQGVDVRRGLSVLNFDATQGVAINVEADLVTFLQRVLDWASIAVAVEQLGTATHAFNLANEYIKVREQFNRPIGSFQAIKHRMADMITKLEMMRSAAYYAVDVVDSGTVDLREASAFARTVCTESLSWISAECVQVHGGIGYTWDYPAQLFVRRAKSTEHLLRSPAKLRDELALLLLN